MQEELAKRAGVRRATISLLESGRVERLNLEVLDRVARAFGVKSLQLLREE